MLSISPPFSGMQRDLWLKGFETLVGKANVLSDAHDIAPMLTDWRGRYHGEALAVVKPGSTEEVAGIVRYAAEQGIRIVPQGGNTGMCAAATPMAAPHPAIVLRLDRMNRIRGISSLGDSIAVDAGCVLAAVQQVAADKDRLFPLSLGAEGSCQIGGNIATNAGGTAALRYGTMRDLVMGVEVVLADGRVLDLMTALRKDSAGYDLRHLFIGSEGTLGIITGAVLKLFPRPKTRAVAMVTCESIRAVLDLLSLARSCLADRISAFELLNREQIRVIAEHKPQLPVPFALDAAQYVLIEVSDTDEKTRLMPLLESVLEQALERGLILDAVPAASEAQAAAFWAIRHSVSEASKAAGYVVSHDSVVPLSAQAQFAGEVEAAIHALRPDARVVIHGHIGDGNLHILAIIKPAATQEQSYAEAQAIHAVVDAVTMRLGGSISAEHGIGFANIDRLAKAAPELELELMRRTKQMLDPEALFNPGKLFV